MVRLWCILSMLVLSGYLGAQPPSKLPKVFVSAVSGAAVGMVISSKVFHAPVEQDRGGYKDGMFTVGHTSDKFVHALSAWTLTSIGTDMRVPPWKSAAIVLGAGVLFEVQQGYISKYDIIADGTGAISAALWKTWINRRQKRGKHERQTKG